MRDLDDPRVQMAAERTLLAWIRTGLAVMALGFALARHEGPGTLAIGLGGGLVLLGAGSLGLASWQYARLFRSLNPADRSGRRRTAPAVWLAVALVVAGLILAGLVPSNQETSLASPPGR